MAQDKVFQQEVAATAKPRSHQRDPLEGPSWHEARLANNAPTTKFPDGWSFENGHGPKCPDREILFQASLPSTVSAMSAGRSIRCSGATIRSGGKSRSSPGALHSPRKSSACPLTPSNTSSGLPTAPCLNALVNCHLCAGQFIALFRQFFSVLVSRNVLTRREVLAGFDPQWPVLKIVEA